MTEAELLELAAGALPESMQKLKGSVVRRAAHALGAGPSLLGLEKVDEDAALLADLERLLETKIDNPQIEDANSADVAFHEDTPLGRRTTVVQIRQGKVLRKIGQA